MKPLIDCSPCRSAETALVILLPGAYMTPTDFVQHGFIKAAREREVDADFLLAEGLTGLFTDQSLLAQRTAAMIEEGLAGNYRRCWLVGISLGAYAAMSYAFSTPGSIDGILGIAPYPGARDAIREVVSSGGLASWSPGEIAYDDYDRQLWNGLRKYQAAARPLPAIYFGLAGNDRFIEGQRLMASALPESHVFERAGEHEWGAWTQLWLDFLQRGMLQGSLPALPQECGR